MVFVKTILLKYILFYYFIKIYFIIDTLLKNIKIFLFLLFFFTKREEKRLKKPVLY